MLMEKIVIYLLLLLVRPGYQNVFTPSLEANIRSFINASMECRHVPGMTLTVVKGDEVWSTGFGTADFSSGQPVDADTLFGIGSVTKSFTTALLGILLQENGYDWSSKVTDILGPHYRFIDNLRTTELTVRDLLSHRTGLARLDIAIVAGVENRSRTDFCKHIKYLPATDPIRDKIIYNNFMYVMLGHVAEVLGKDTWENLVRSRLFEPVGMNNSRILMRPEDLIAEDVARPYIYKDDQIQLSSLQIYEFNPIQPALGILSTANDMAKWIRFQLQKGKTENGTQLIDEKLIDDMHWVTTPLDKPSTLKNRFLTRPQWPVEDTQLGYGYSWFVSVYRGYKSFWHSGGLLSHTTLFEAYPDMDIGISASVNGPDFWNDSLAHLTTVLYYLSDHLLGLEPWLNETTACTYPAPWNNDTETKPKDPEVPVTIDNASEFEGVYSYPLFPTAEVMTNDSNLLMDINRLHGILHPSSEKDRFLWEITAPWELANLMYGDTFYNITFFRDNTTGAVAGFRMVDSWELKATTPFTKTSRGSMAGFSIILYLVSTINQLLTI